MHTPDLFEGRTFPSIDAGLAYIRGIGFDDMRERGVRLADQLPSEARLRRVLLRRAAGTEARAYTARRPRRPALLPDGA